MDRSRILIVEDDPVNSLVLEKRLFNLGYEVCGIAKHAREAMELAQETSPDLVLMDIQLEGEMDGIDASFLIRSQFKIPIVFATAFTDDALLERAALCEPFGYIVKPYGERELRSVIEMALYRRFFEQRARQDEDRFRKLTEMSPFGLLVANKDGRIEYLNERFSQMIGFDHAELPDMKTFSAAVQPDCTTRHGNGDHCFMKFHSGSGNSAVSDCECALTCKDGGKKIFAIRVAHLETGGILCAYLDVTVAAKARLEILHAGAEWERTFNAVTDPVMVLDGDHRILRTNTAMAEILGVKPQDAIGRRCYELAHGSTRPIPTCPHARLLIDGVEHCAEVLDYKIGSAFDVRACPMHAADGALIGSVHIARDITERKNLELAITSAKDTLEDQVRERTRELLEQTRRLEEEIRSRVVAQEALRSSEQRFRAVFESAGECIFIKDTELRYAQVNPYMERLVGHSAEELAGKTDGFLYGESAAHTRAVELRVLQGETVEEEHTRTINGSITTFYDVRTPLMDGKGEIVGILGVSRDVTELRRATATPRITGRPFVAKATRKVQERALLAAREDCVVLLLGESGSGKDWFARYIHDHSSRSGGSFFSVNCAAISPQLAESELFGHERGAFTGAGRRKRGLLELAEGGSLLLNEVGEMPLPLQSKLLTFLDTRAFTRVGGEELVKVNARLLVATNRDLPAEVEAGTFRRDLFYRINVFPMQVPPLRERADDIPHIIDELLKGLGADLPSRQTTHITPEALEAMKRYQWPGNIRELRNVLERALILSRGGVVGIESLQLEHKLVGDWNWATSFPPKAPYNDLVTDLKRSLIEEALQRCRGKRVEAAEILGMTRDALKKQIKTLGIADEQ